MTCKWLITHGDRKSPKDWVIPLPKWPKLLINGDYSPLTNWDDPPRRGSYPP